MKTGSEVIYKYGYHWIESRNGPAMEYQFERIETEPEESIWYCQNCDSTDVDAHEGICFNCTDDEE